MTVIEGSAIDVDSSLDNDDDSGWDPANEGDGEIVVPAPGPVSIYVQVADEDVSELLVVGWNSSGSPIVVGDNGGLRLLADEEKVREITW